MSDYNSRQMLEKLISFDTTSWKSNLQLIDFVKDYLAGYGVECHLFFNDEENKANMLATIGPKDKSGIILSGHTDVVPVEGQNWSSDPFAMIEKDGKLYGRGTADMKGFVACVLAAVPNMLKRSLKEPVHLAFSYDEEVGCSGVNSMVDFVADMSPLPRACIVGEPSSMKVINSHKGINGMVTRIYGQESHSSSDKGFNAISVAADMIHFLNRLADELKERMPAVEGFDPPFTTMNIGRISGGSAINITANYCEFEWEYRVMPGTEQHEIRNRFEDYCEREILPKMQASGLDHVRYETEYFTNVAPLLPQSGSDAETLALSLANRNDTEVVSYCTEAGIFQSTARVPTVVCGPGRIDEAHRPDEYLALDQLAACDEFLDRLLDVISE